MPFPNPETTPPVTKMCLTDIAQKSSHFNKNNGPVPVVPARPYNFLFTFYRQGPFPSSYCNKFQFFLKPPLFFPGILYVAPELL